MRPEDVELRIEELALHGFAPGDRRRIDEALKRELARLFAEEGVPASLVNSADVPSLDGGAFDVSPGSRADAVGAQVARALYRGMTR